MNAQLFDVLAENGITLDSSLGVGDLKYNLPVDTAHTSRLQGLFHGRPMFEFPLVAEDGMKTPTVERVEMQQRNLAWFLNEWEYAMLRNAENGSITTLLVHPSRGTETPEDNIGVKVRALEHLIQVARAHRIAVDSLVHFGDFWRARSKVTLDTEFDAVTGYAGTFVVGDEPVEDFTVEFGDAIESFVCAACGRVEIHRKRVVMRDRLAAGTFATFTAKPREASHRSP